jgi:molybdenum cofactor cytidylyltransferase
MSMLSDQVNVSIVPAAGYSVRMAGRNKLLLPWQETSTVMDEVLKAWTESKATRVVVVVRADDSELQRVCRNWKRVELVCPPLAPRDMKESIQRGIEFLSNSDDCIEINRWFVAPADMPTLNSRIINRLIEASANRAAIVIPRFAGRRGHPISLPWKLAKQISTLSENDGIDCLLRDNPIEFIDLEDEKRPEDIDTYEDYVRLREQHLI